MSRPRLRRRIRFSPHATYYKPQGVPMRQLENIFLSTEEVEALRLKYVKQLEQIECAKQMGTSQSTFQRILYRANKKVAEAIIGGKAIKIINNA